MRTNEFSYHDRHKPASGVGKGTIRAGSKAEARRMASADARMQGKTIFGIVRVSDAEATGDLPFGGSHAPDCPYRHPGGECLCWRSDPEQNPELDAE